MPSLDTPDYAPRWGNVRGRACRRDYGMRAMLSYSQAAKAGYITDGHDRRAIAVRAGR